MIALRVVAPYGSFRKSFARSFAETYSLPPPSTVYGMLLSLVGERFRWRHAGVRLAFAYRCRREMFPDRYPSSEGACNCFPPIATNVRKLSRFKYGVAQGEKLKTLKPDYVETLCEIEFLCWIDSSGEKHAEDNADARTLEERLIEAITEPDKVARFGVLSLGLSDDAIDEVSLYAPDGSKWHKLLPSDTGRMELPIWVAHVGAKDTKWQRYDLQPLPRIVDEPPSKNEWIQITVPLRSTA